MWSWYLVLEIISQLYVQFFLVFFDNVANAKSDGSYLSLRLGVSVFIHPSSSLAKVGEEIVVFNDIVTTVKSFIRTVSPCSSSFFKSVASLHSRQYL
jgi:hypothetical protein